MANFFLPWPPLKAAVEILASLTHDEFEEIKSSVRSDKALDRSPDRLRELRQRLGGRLEVHELFQFFAALDFFYDQLKESREQGEPPEQRLSEFLELTELSDAARERKDEVLTRLKSLLAPIASLEREKKLHWLKTGLLPTGVSFSSFVDLRPYFDRERAVIEELVPAILLRIETETQYGAEDDFVMQLTEKGLTKLRAVVEDIERKLALAKTLKVTGLKGVGSDGL